MMKIKCAITFCVLATALFARTVWGNVHTNVLAELRRLCDRDDPDISERALLEGSFEIRFTPGLYEPLVVSMSNCWQDVLANLDAYATNTVERLLVLNTGWWMDESVHLQYLRGMCDMVEAGRLTAAEFDAYDKASWRRHTVGSALARRFDECATSNLLRRIKSFSPRTNYWSQVSSGEIKNSYQEQLADGLWN